MLVLVIRNNGEDALVIEHAGETLLIAVAPQGPHGQKVRVLLHGPKSFGISRGGVMKGG